MSMGCFESKFCGSGRPVSEIATATSIPSTVGVSVRGSQVALPSTASMSDGFTSGADPGESAAA
ncbi:hypothetical protein HGA13_27505 [Nocardia speluncae]|uniref:Uncharacterized protein n=1 Tax=Nocardia speluncae TaxID=419477 RepID=A0A846XNL1_9NOCA|nr:hypothetical protein [Nocardia speluncae]NKY36789.1 hypothetical protein [Nocardia speluncae]